MKLQDAFDQTWAQLQGAHVPQARLEAEYLVSEAAGIPRLRLALEKTRLLSHDAEQQILIWTQERLKRKPLAYVLGQQPFLHLDLLVTPSVLVPRPETELLVEEAYRVLDLREHASVVDVGTGSGNIALSLAMHKQVAEVHAIDLSPEALLIAQKNALRNHVTKFIHWHCGDLLAPISQSPFKADLIVANLPYIRTGELSTLSPEVRWEPQLALDGGTDGLQPIYRVIEQSEHVLKPGGVLLLEIGFDQDLDVLERLASRPSWKDAKLQHDLAGLPRIIRAEKGVSYGLFND